jgi:folylpolyglutamate synthase
MIKFKTTGGVFAAQHMETKEETRRVIVRLPDMSEREIAWSSLDFRPTPQAQENEYALPPKRSRREIVPAPQFVDPVHYQMPEEHMGYHPRANAVVLVDSKAHSHGHPFPNGPGLGHFVSHPMRGMPPPMLPGMGMRGMGGRAAIVPPRVQAPFRMAATTGAPQPNGGGVVNGNNGGRSNAPGGPAQCPPHTPVIPGGVGKIDLGLDRMIALMGKLPPMTVPAFHLAGTNGKGSVSVILESCLNAAGMRTARYNSPHLLEPRDAVRLNGHPVSAEEYAAAISHVQRVSDENRLEATTFEIGTAAAFLIANTAQPPVDAMIIECGMGGLRDATNVLPPQLVLASGLTSVGLDHTDRLGDTIAKIAREKSSICVPGGVLVVAPHLHPQALESARTVTAERGSHIVVSAASQATRTDTTMSLVPFREPAPTFVRTPLAGAKTRVLDTQLSLGGAHQLDNLSLALTLLDVVRNDARSRSIQPKLEYLVDSRLQAGVAAARWHGRCAWLQWRDPHTGTTVPFLVDGAHNADSAVTLRAYLDSLDVPGPRTFVISLSASPGKTPDGVLRPLLRRGDRLALAQFTTPVEGMPWIRAADSEDLRAAALPLTDGGEIHTVPGVGPAAVAEALRWAQNGHGGQGLTVLCGSLYLVAEAYRLVAQ